MLIHIVAGVRPNFTKAAPLIRAAEAAGVDARLIHTGQHYHPGLSQVFFDELGLPPPHRHLKTGSSTQGQETARALEGLEAVFAEERPDWVLVLGDANSTLAGALAAVKLGIRCAHVEAGLRSFDQSMPEESNRIVTDAISDALFVSEPAGVENLTREGHPANRIHLVGNVMIDTLNRFLPEARERHSAQVHGLQEGAYALLTLHRPSNVDRAEDLDALIDKLAWAQARLPILFPLHPRTRTRLEQLGRTARLEALPDLQLVEPVGYLDFLSLMATSKVVLTDSGGIQEETTALGVPCLTLRENTERPITCEQGTNQLVGARGDALPDTLTAILDGQAPRGARPELWDGRAAERIIRALPA